VHYLASCYYSGNDSCSTRNAWKLTISWHNGRLPAFLFLISLHTSGSVGKPRLNGLALNSIKALA